ncbi:MAG TPA: elongation factor P [Candidatus Paceibacterota bacterium]
MLEYNEITVRKCIVFEGEPYEVLSSHVFRKQMRKPVNATKLKNLISGRVVEHSFGATDKAEEAEIETRKVKFLYENKGEWWFCEEKDPSKRFKLDADLVGSAGRFMKANTLVDITSFDEKPFGVKLPVKVELKVTEAPPSIKGDSAKGGNKVVTLETGATINAPLFITEGEIVRINTDTGEYVERVGGNSF